ASSETKAFSGCDIISIIIITQLSHLSIFSKAAGSIHYVLNCWLVETTVFDGVIEYNTVIIFDLKINHHSHVANEIPSVNRSLMFKNMMSVLVLALLPVVLLQYI